MIKMVNTNELKAVVMCKGLLLKDVYTAIGLTKRQFQTRMAQKKFDSEEIMKISTLLNLNADDVMRIFFVAGD